MPRNQRARAGACKTCRVRHRRCIPVEDDPFGPCRLCRSLGIACTIEMQHDRDHQGPGLFASPSRDSHCSPPLQISNLTFQTPSLPLKVSSGWSRLLPPRPLLFELIALYFRLIHNGPHTLFHEPSFLADVENASAPASTLFAMLSLSARFSKNPFFDGTDPRVRGHSYADSAMQLLQKALIHPSLDTVQGYILMSQYLGGEGDGTGKDILIALAVSHAQILRLWEKSPNSTTIFQEVSRRTWLSVVIAHKWSVIDEVGSSLSIESYNKRFPALDELQFANLRPGAVEYLPPSQQPACGFWAQIAQTIDLFDHINKMISCVASGKRSILSYAETIADLDAQLDTWVRNLPAEMAYNEENLMRFNHIGFGKEYLAMHIAQFHSRQLLYYPFLDTRQNSSASNPTYTMLCKKNAIAVSEVAKAAFNSPSSELVYFIIGHVLVVSSSIHLHTLLFSEVEEAPVARNHLLSNFEILMRLKIYWPAIDISVGRLRSFQNDCRKSMTNTFVLDNWMLQFLAEHSTTIKSHRWLSEETHVASDPPSDSIADAGQDAFDSRAVGSLDDLMTNKNLSNNDLVENVLSWLID